MQIQRPPGLGTMPSQGPAIRRPIGFTLLALFLGWQALSGFLLAIDVGLGPLPDQPVRGLSLLVPVFAAVAAEALWRCRPWCARAMAGYILAAILAPLAAAAVAGRLIPDQALSSVFGYGLVAILPMWYVAYRAGKLFGPAAPRVGIRVPAPPP